MYIIFPVRVVLCAWCSLVIMTIDRYPLGHPPPTLTSTYPTLSIHESSRVANRLSVAFPIRYGYDAGSTRKCNRCDDSNVLPAIMSHQRRAPGNVEMMEGVTGKEPVATHAAAEYGCKLLNTESFGGIELYERCAR